ncbi:MAG: hypothetical protein KatS3mg102_1812 [Planctomycetota bacterium]|nr:MAG: hypothetical protein KatS3mg102_1812 [Planctomycetota bacterium]
MLLGFTTPPLLAAAGSDPGAAGPAPELSFIYLFLVLLLAWVAGGLASRLGYPAILGELTAGMVCGPAVLGWLHDDPALRVLAEVGVYLLMLYIGMEIDHRELQRSSVAGILAAAGGFVVPFAAGIGVTRLYGGSLHEGLFLGLAMGVTSLATKSRILVDLDLVGTRIANVLMAGALIADTAALVVFAAILGFAQAGSVEFVSVALVALKAVVFFGVTIALGLKAFPWIGALMARLGFTARTTNFTMVLLIGLVFAEAAHLAGLHAILGAFLAGLFMREEVLQRRLSDEVARLVHDLSIGFLAPIFFVMAGLHVSFDVFRTDLGLLVTIVLAATLTKILGTALFYLPSGRGWREGLVVGAGMNGRGAVEIIVAEIGLQMGMISQEVFSILVFMAFATTLTVPVLLKLGVGWLRRRGELAAGSEGRDLTLILGADAVGQAMAQALGEGERVVLIDRNRAQCEIAAAAGYRVVCGNVLEHATLQAAQADRARRFVALVPNAEVCALAARLLKDEFLVPRAWAITASRAGRAIGPLLEAAGVRPLWISEQELLDLAPRLPREGVVLEELVIPEAIPLAEAAALLEFGRTRLPLVRLRRGEAEPLALEGGLEPGDRVRCLPLMSAPVRVAGEGLIGQLLGEDGVLDLPGIRTREPLLQALAEALGARLQRPAAQLLEALRAREEAASTAIAPGVAIPHVRAEDEQQLVLIAARTPDGVGSADGEPLYAHFAIAAGAARRGEYLRLVAAIARLASHPRFLDRWRSAAGVAQLRGLLVAGAAEQQADQPEERRERSGAARHEPAPPASS